ncbi:glycosyltransferase family 4 protein [Candidatus Woesearchaeota archaeon]|nr:glycosyltransferase family 4 protein [Candidatus Woesearchaeota archaeon]
MKIVHTYIRNMYIDPKNANKDNFADKWGLTSQAKLGHQVTLICSTKGPRKEYSWKGIKVIELPTLIEITASTRIIKGLLKELLKIDVDIFHAHHYCSLVPEITLLAAKLRQKPVFVTMHSSFQGRSGIAGFFEQFYGVLMQPFLPFYKKVLFISKYIKDNKFFRLLPKTKKIVTINQYKKPPKLNIKRIDNSILFIGRVTHLKGIDILIRSLAYVRKKIPDVQLNVVGKYGDKYMKKLNKLITKLKLNKNINFLGPLYENDKWKQFYSNTIQVVPSRDEGFGNIVIEGMLCNIPLIVSNCGALPEAANGNALIFDIKKPKDLAKKIIRLLKDGKLRKELTEKANKYAIRLTKERLGKQLINIYNGP